MRPRGFVGLRCPRCGEDEGVAVMVETLGLHCTECAEPITRAEVQTMIDKWASLLAWIDSAQPLGNGARTTPAEAEAPLAS